MAVGDVVLDGRPYILSDARTLMRSNANQMSAKIGGGAGDYDDLQNWSAWAMDNWTVGIGKKDAEAGGSLFTTCDTRFENQLILPLHKTPLGKTPTNLFKDYSGSEFQLRSGNTGTITTVGSGSNLRLAEAILVPDGDVLKHIDVYLPGKATATQVKVEVWSATASPGLPNAMIEAFTITLNGEEGHSWYNQAITALSPSGSDTYYFVVIYPVSSTVGIIGYATGGYRYNGTSWAGTAPGFLALYHRHAENITAAPSKIVEFSGSSTYVVNAAMGTGLYGLDQTSLTWVVSKGEGVTITDLLATGTKLYIGLGDSTNYDTRNTVSTFAAGSVPARLFALHKGFLWRAVDRDVYYTGDESTWTQIVPTVADPGYKIRGMAGYQDDMIVSTDNQLLRIGWGDIVQTITRWPVSSTLNGKHMLNWQGNLYISVGKSLLRYDGASLLPIGPDLDEGLPYTRHGDIVALANNNNYLLVGIAGTTYSSIWGYNGQGWHCINELPKSTTLATMEYIVDGVSGGSQRKYYRERIVACTSQSMPTYRVSHPDTARSSFKLAEDEGVYAFELCGVLETDWFHGGLHEVDKDFESVFIDGENIDSNKYIQVYWQDDASAGVWELLGTVDSVGEELRWSNSATRPSSKNIKLKLVLISLERLETPVVTAVRVKYMPMVIDRWRWQLNIKVPPEPQQMIDGDTETTQTQAQKLTHLDGLTKRVPPFLYTDTDGVQYEVKVLNASRQVSSFEYYDGGKKVEYVYAMTIEQAQKDAYSA